MTQKSLLACLVVGFGVSAALPASAFVQVYGSTNAYSCFIAAKTGLDLDAGQTLCDHALKDDYLNARDRAGTLNNRGAIKAARGRYADAMTDYDSALRMYPDLGDAYIDRGAALISLKRYDEALVDINKGISLNPSSPHIGYYNRAVGEELMGKFKEAYYDYKHVLELEPDFIQASDRLKNFVVTTKPASS